MISNNTVGVAISQGATGNKVLGNRIGTDPTGIAAIPNERGVVINGAANNEVGNGTLERVNIISGNAENGIEIVQATGNTVKGNKIGASQAETASEIVDTESSSGTVPAPSSVEQQQPRVTSSSTTAATVFWWNRVRGLQGNLAPVSRQLSRGIISESRFTR